MIPAFTHLMTSPRTRNTNFILTIQGTDTLHFTFHLKLKNAVRRYKAKQISRNKTEQGHVSPTEGQIKTYKRHLKKRQRKILQKRGRYKRWFSVQTLVDKGVKYKKTTNKSKNRNFQFRTSVRQCRMCRGFSQERKVSEVGSIFQDEMTTNFTAATTKSCPITN